VSLRKRESEESKTRLGGAAGERERAIEKGGGSMWANLDVYWGVRFSTLGGHSSEEDNYAHKYHLSRS